MMLRGSAGGGMHPYWPPTASIPDFVPNTDPLIRLLPTFSVLVAGAVAPVVIIASRIRPRLRPIDVFAAGWFALCAFLHIAFEGYYITLQAAVAAESTTFAQLWKEYAKSDSRYLTADCFTVCVETITVLLWGPLCLVAMLAIVRQSPAVRHVIQIVLCTAHLYGVALYYFTNYKEYQVSGVLYSRPEFLYFWVYYVGFNAPWAIVPFWLLWDSFQEIEKGFVALKTQQAGLKTK